MLIQRIMHGSLIPYEMIPAMQHAAADFGHFGRCERMGRPDGSKGGFLRFLPGKMHRFAIESIIKPARRIIVK